MFQGKKVYCCPALHAAVSDGVYIRAGHWTQAQGILLYGFHQSYPHVVFWLWDSPATHQEHGVNQAEEGEQKLLMCHCQKSSLVWVLRLWSGGSCPGMDLGVPLVNPVLEIASRAWYFSPGTTEFLYNCLCLVPGDVKHPLESMGIWMKEGVAEFCLLQDVWQCCLHSHGKCTCLVITLCQWFG